MVLAILFALVVGASITHDFHMKILRRMRLTYKTARDSTWIDIFIDQRRYVEVAFTDGRRLFGWPLYYSNQPEEGLLYLYDAAWIDAEGKYVDLDAHGILLTKKEDIESIVFTDLEFGQAGPRGEDRRSATTELVRRTNRWAMSEPTPARASRSRRKSRNEATMIRPSRR